MRNILVIFVAFLSQVSFAGVSIQPSSTTINYFLEKLQKYQPVKYSEYTELEHRVSIHIKEETVTTHITRIFTYPTHENIQNSGTGRIAYNGVNEKVTIHSAAAVSPTGAVTRITDGDVKIIDSDSYDTFSSYKRALLPYNGLEAGGYSVLDYTITQDRKLSEIDIYDRFYPQLFVPRQNYNLKITWDSGQKPKFISRSQVIECTENESEIICSGHNISAAKSDSAVFWKDQLDFIEYSALRNWSDVVNKTQRLFDNALDTQDGLVQGFIDSNIDNDLSLEEKVSLAHQFVARDVRYLSRSEHGHAVTPHNTIETLAKRLGDCKDKSALLIDILNRIGIEANPVLVSTKKRKFIPELLPSLSQFNHAVVCFRLKGNQYCIDATDNYTDWRYYPDGIQGRYSLEIVAGAQPKLLPTDKHTWNLSVETQVTFDNEGGQSEVQTKTYSSQAAASYKSYLAQYNNDERNEKLTEIYQDHVAGSAQPVFSYSEVSSINDQFEIKSSTKFEPSLNTKEKLEYYEYDAWIKKTIKDHEISNKHYEVNMSGSLVKSIYRYNTSDIWEVTQTTADLDLSSPFGSLRRSSSIDDGIVSVETTLDIPARKLETNEFNAFNEFLDALEKESVIWLIGEPK